MTEIRHLPADTAPSFTGILRTRCEADLALCASRRIAERLVDTGAAVSAGQVIFRLDPGDLDLALRAAAATASQARNDAPPLTGTGRRRACFRGLP